MHRYVGTVFKVLGISIIMMAVLDTSLVVFDTISVHSKVSSMSWIMQNELAKNNCIPNSIKPTFQNQLQTIVNNSSVASNVKTNMNGAVTLGNTRYESVAESSVGNYGDIKPLVVSVEMSPTKVLFNTNQGNRNNGSLLSKTRFTYTLNFVYYVPCLRYLK